MLFFGKSLISPLDKVDDSLGRRVETLDKFEAPFIAFLVLLRQ